MATQFYGPLINPFATKYVKIDERSYPGDEVTFPCGCIALANACKQEGINIKALQEAIKQEIAKNKGIDFTKVLHDSLEKALKNGLINKKNKQKLEKEFQKSFKKETACLLLLGSLKKIADKLGLSVHFAILKSDQIQLETTTIKELIQKFKSDPKEKRLHLVCLCGYFNEGNSHFFLISIDKEKDTLLVHTDSIAFSKNPEVAAYVRELKRIYQKSPLLRNIAKKALLLLKPVTT